MSVGGAAAARPVQAVEDTAGSTKRERFWVCALPCPSPAQVEHPLVVPHVERMEGSQCSVLGLSKTLVVSLLVEAAGEA